MIVLVDDEGNQFETCRIENIRRDYRKVVAFGLHKMRQTGKTYRLEYKPVRNLH